MTTLDLKGLQCPLPVLRANKTLRAMIDGAEVCILATDAAAPADFAAFCRSARHTLVSCEETEGVYAIVIRKGG